MWLSGDTRSVSSAPGFRLSVYSCSLKSHDGIGGRTEHLALYRNTGEGDGRLRLHAVDVPLRFDMRVASLPKRLTQPATPSSLADTWTYQHSMPNGFPCCEAGVRRWSSAPGLVSLFSFRHAKLHIHIARWLQAIN